MDALTVYMGITAAIAVGLLVWTYTKSGERWLKSLD